MQRSKAQSSAFAGRGRTTFFLQVATLRFEFRNEVANAFGASITAILDGLSLPAGHRAPGASMGKRILIRTPRERCRRTRCKRVRNSRLRKTCVRPFHARPRLAAPGWFPVKPRSQSSVREMTHSRRRIERAPFAGRAVFGFRNSEARVEMDAAAFCAATGSTGLRIQKRTIASARVNSRFHIVCRLRRRGQSHAAVA